MWRLLPEGAQHPELAPGQQQSMIRLQCMGDPGLAHLFSAGMLALTWLTAHVSC